MRKTVNQIVNDAVAETQRIIAIKHMTDLRGVALIADDAIDIIVSPFYPIDRLYTEGMEDSEYKRDMKNYLDLEKRARRAVEHWMVKEYGEQIRNFFVTGEESPGSLRIEKAMYK